MESNLFLTDEELKIMTGYKSAKKQCEWLTNQKIQFYKSKVGKPIVIRNILVNGIVHCDDEIPDFGAL